LVLGVTASLIAIVLYGAINSDPDQLTVSEMEDTVA
jgi:hypothetical protein